MTKNDKEKVITECQSKMIKILFKETGLTLGDLPAFPPKDFNFVKFLILTYKDKILRDAGKV